MKSVILGATGGVGQQLVAQATAAGHHVLAVVRDPARLTPGITSVTIDLSDSGPSQVASLESAFAGADAVLSALGPRSSPDVGVVESATRAVVPAMQAVGVRRFAGISAAPISRNDPGNTLIMRAVMAPIARLAFRKTYADLEAAEELLRASELNWTMVRPPRLTDQPLTSTYRSAVGQNLRGGMKVGRADVAHLMLAVVDRPETFGTTVGIAD